MKFFLLFGFVCLVFSSCTPDNEMNSQIIAAYVPVYLSTQNAGKISKEPPRPIKQPGKIYVFGNWLFQNDVNEGIHIIDISIKAKPVKVSFLAIPLSTEVAVKGNFLYTNNVSDLLAFNISDPTNPVLVKRIANVFPLSNQQYPPFFGVSFECADPSKGLIVNWELKQISKPNCRR